MPLGYETLGQFMKAKFELQDIIIKVQHRDRSSEFYVRSDSRRILLSHEYLFILRKPKEPRACGHLDFPNRFHFSRQGFSSLPRPYHKVSGRKVPDGPLIGCRPRLKMADG